MATKRAPLHSTLNSNVQARGQGPRITPKKMRRLRAGTFQHEIIRQWFFGAAPPVGRVTKNTRLDCLGVLNGTGFMMNL